MSGEYISEPLRRLVLRRARHRCEYCWLPQGSQEATFHLDHVHPRSLGGLTVAENLALACVGCSLRKGARTSGVDPLTGDRISLYNPRSDAWNAHFRWTPQSRVVGRSACGRATIESLELNRPVLVRIRQCLARRGELGSS